MFLLPVMLLVFSGGSAEVVDNFKSKCPQYFMNEIPPTVLRGDQYKPICQTLDNIQYFATLYDTNNKIPVYSAYKYIGKEQCTRSGKWYIEPQLEDNSAEKNMELKGRRVLKKQASNKDYEKKDFDKGHLAPVSHANSQRCSDATFTLTNAAPQTTGFNRGQWRQVENCMSETVKNHCEARTAYIVTGVVPGKKNDEVTVPSHFWTAYCCTEHKTNTLISGGLIGENSKNKPIPYQFNVTDLETELKNLYQVDSFFLFDNNCREADYVPVIPDSLIRQSRKKKNFCHVKTMSNLDMHY